MLLFLKAQSLIRRCAIVVATLPWLAAGCIGGPDVPNLGGLYDRAAQAGDEHRNPVIVIPGILGSKLRDGPTGRIVWGAFAGDYADPTTDDGARLVALPMRSGAPLRDLVDDVRPNGALDRLRVNLLGLPVQLSAYFNILGTLGVGGYRDELLAQAGAVNYGDAHFTCFQFDYDWRRDNVENARRLHAFILAKREYVRRELKKRSNVDKPDLKFDIVAHSMGGLITRYFLMYGDADLPADGSVPPPTWAGAAYVDKTIIIGTPNAGSIKALVQMVDGATFSPILPTYPPAVLGTMPSVYQLLPRGRHGCMRDAAGGERGEPIADLCDLKEWVSRGWGLADPDQDGVLRQLLPDVAGADERRRIALDHLTKCLSRARQFAAALDQPATPPAEVRMHLFAGDAVLTDEAAVWDARRRRVSITRQAPGDGTVLRSSALMDERLAGEWSPHLRSPIRWTNVTFLFVDHIGLTSSPAFSDNVLYLLLEAP